MTTDVAALKQLARMAARRRRDGCDPTLGATLAGHVLRDWPPPPGAVVAGFWPIAGEIDIRPLLVTLHERGHAVVLPETPPMGQALRFRLWYPGMAMVAERFGTMRPTGDPCAPDMLFVPLLAFDASGARLGYGGGFYDRTLAGLPSAVAIGCGFVAQEIEAVPTEATDIRLHGIATERGVRRFEAR